MSTETSLLAIACWLWVLIVFLRLHMKRRRDFPPPPPVHGSKNFEKQADAYIKWLENFEKEHCHGRLDK